jgi:TRAP-type C4-dicarboxylate transport system substrate-binding protein
MIRRQGVIVIAIVLAFLIGKVGVIEAKVTIKVGDIMGPKTVQAQALYKFVEYAKEFSKGELEIQYFPGSQLGTAETQVQNVSHGIQDMWVSTPEFLHPFSNALRIDERPFVFDTREQYEKWLLSSDFTKIDEELAQKANQRFFLTKVFWRRGPTKVWISTKPIYTLADAKGTIMRLWADEGIHKFYRGLGFSTVTIPFGDVYNGFQRGICNTTEVPFDAIEGMGFIEVAKFVIWSEVYWQVLTPTINVKKLDSLSPALRKNLADAWNKAGEEYNQTVFSEVEPTKDRILKKNGVIIYINRDPWIKKVRTEVIPALEKEGFLPEGTIKTLEKYK